jgi:hypothetical protein
MDFNGLTGGDFDFFKKKDKMLKEEYETRRNDLKMHFRSLCYEIQKMYHKNTDGVFEVNKEFQNFNKRSMNISAEHKNSEDSSIILNMDSNNLKVELILNSSDEKSSGKIMTIINNKKTVLLEHAMSSKYMVIYAEFAGRNKKDNMMKLSALDVNNKNYDNFISFINKGVSEGKHEFTLGTGYAYSKNECVKQGKALSNTVYGSTIELMDLFNKIV